MKVLLRLKDYINLVVPNPPGTSDWTLMEKCVERLLPIADATEGVESDAATLETVTRCVPHPQTPVPVFIGLRAKTPVVTVAGTSRFYAVIGATRRTSARSTRRRCNR